MKLLARLSNLIDRIWISNNRKKFYHFGNNVLFERPLAVHGMENMSVASNVRIASSIWLVAMPINGESCHLKIGEGTVIGHFNHIFATKSVEIGNYVITADKVYISDNSHSYEDISLPVLKQPLKQLAPVKIGDESWIGENVCIFGASVGKHCVIGANSVVTRDIPDYSIAVGSPAKVIKKYDVSQNKWVRV